MNHPVQQAVPLTVQLVANHAQDRGESSTHIYLNENLKTIFAYIVFRKKMQNEPREKTGGNSFRADRGAPIPGTAAKTPSASSANPFGSGASMASSSKNPFGSGDGRAVANRGSGSGSDGDRRGRGAAGPTLSLSPPPLPRRSGSPFQSRDSQQAAALVVSPRGSSSSASSLSNVGPAAAATGGGGGGSGGSGAVGVVVAEAVGLLQQAGRAVAALNDAYDAAYNASSATDGWGGQGHDAAELGEVRGGSGASASASASAWAWACTGGEWRGRVRVRCSWGCTHMFCFFVFCFSSCDIMSYIQTNKPHMWRAV